MGLCTYFICFIVISLIGWIYESVYGIFALKKWDRRGFLLGPICPIYGFGVISIMFIRENLSYLGITRLEWYEIFIFSFLGSVVLEYATSYFLEKIFHAVWWDYSNFRFNIHGRVCFVASFFFGVLGVVSYLYVVPFFLYLMSFVPEYVLVPVTMLLVAVLSCDITLTVSTLSNFQKNVVAINERMNNQMDVLVATLVEKNPLNKEREKEVIKAEADKALEETVEHVMESVDDPTYKRIIGKIFQIRYPVIEKMKLDRILSAVQKYQKKKDKDKDDA